MTRLEPYLSLTLAVRYELADAACSYLVSTDMPVYLQALFLVAKLP
jgi:hypothetical protein